MVKIDRITSDGADVQVEHTEATRRELVRALELAKSKHSIWQGTKQISVIAALSDRLQEVDREASVADAMKVARGARTTAWIAAGAAVASAVAAITLAVMEYLRYSTGTPG